jgi:hypothetical protein
MKGITYEVLVTGRQRGRVCTLGSRFSDEATALNFANEKRKRGMFARVEKQDENGYAMQVISDR